MTAPTIRLTVAAVLLASVASIGCAPITVHSFMERGVDLRSYRTYEWAPVVATPTGDPRLDSNRFFEEQVRMRVDEELARRGFEKTTTGSPDMTVHYHANFTQDILSRDLDLGYLPCTGEDCGPSIYDKGTLLVDLIDAKTKQLMWRGWAEGNVSGNVDSQDWMEARVDEAVAKILARLPNRL